MRIGTAAWGNDPTASAAVVKKTQEPATFIWLTSMEPTVFEP
jgi:hypothetical protein